MSTPDFPFPFARLNADFQTTHWSVILKVGTNSEETQVALKSLCENYWYPLYAFVRRAGKSKEEAEDLTQEFFHRFLERDALKAANPDRGRFRTFLIASLKNFLTNEWKASQRLKRGGGREILSWEGLNAEDRFASEPRVTGSLEEAFDQQWAQTVVSNAMVKVKKDFDRDEMKERFDVLSVFLKGDRGGVSYAEAGEQLGLAESAVKSAIFRMRQRYGQAIREEVANTVESEDQIEGEIDYLIGIFNQG